MKVEARLRGQEVVVRTARGIEIAEVMSPASPPKPALNETSFTTDSSTVSTTDSTDGKILRRLTAEDRLLQQQLTHAAKLAFESCQQHLIKTGSRDCLLDVEPLMDGKTLYFHFIGTPDESLTEHLQSLAEIFRATVQASQFAKLLDEGCGPGCGTEEKGSCGDSGTCSVCVIAKACKK